MTRVIGKFDHSERIGDLVAALKEVGIPRQDMIISDDVPGEVDLEDVDFLRTETEELGGLETYGESVEMPLTPGKILVAVESSKRRKEEVVDAMVRFGASRVKVD